MLILNITRVTILVGQGADKVVLHTTEPSPCPGVSSESLGLDFSVAKGSGLSYVLEVLDIHDNIEVIDAN